MYLPLPYLTSRNVIIISFRYIIPLPKLHFDLSRILIFKLKDIADPSQMDPYAIFAHLINIVEIRFFEDFCSGHVVLFDLEHCKFNHITKVSPSYIKNAYTIGEVSFQRNYFEKQ